MDEENTVPPCLARKSPREPIASFRVVVGPDGPVRFPVIIVPMEDGERSVLERDDFARLMKDGYTDQFFYSPNKKGGQKYVCTRRMDDPVVVVRVHHLVYGRTGKTHIGFHDRNPLNLLRDNLGPVKGRFKRPERVPETAA